MLDHVVELDDVWVIDFFHDAYFRLEKSGEKLVGSDFFLGNFFNCVQFGLLVRLVCGVLAGNKNLSELSFSELSDKSVVSDRLVDLHLIYFCLF